MGNLKLSWVVGLLSWSGENNFENSNWVSSLCTRNANISIQQHTFMRINPSQQMLLIHLMIFIPLSTRTAAKWWLIAMISLLISFSLQTKLYETKWIKSSRELSDYSLRWLPPSRDALLHPPAQKPTPKHSNKV